MKSTELIRSALAASECAADVTRQNPEAGNANVNAMNKAEIIAELRDKIEAFLALQAKNESQRKLDAALLSLYDKGLVECKWADTARIRALRMNNRGAEYAKA